MFSWLFRFSRSIRRCENVYCSNISFSCLERERSKPSGRSQVLVDDDRLNLKKQFQHESLRRRQSTSVPGTARVDRPVYSHIYKFNYIKHVRALCRVKLLQIGLMVPGVPLSYGLAYLDFLSVNNCHTFTSLTLFTCFGVYVLSEFTRRAVGFIYLDQKGRSVKVSHLTFWGTRKDVVMPIDDVIPFADASERPSWLYVKLLRYSSKEVLYICLKYGVIVDMDSFQRVFGDLTI